MIFPACFRALRVLRLLAALPLVVACATPRPAAVDAPTWHDGTAAPSLPIDSLPRQPTDARRLAPDGARQAKPPLDAATLKPAPLAPLLDLTAPPDDLWQRIRRGFSMPDLHHPLVADRQSWYLNRPEMLSRLFGRGERYLYHIVAELEKRGMPMELALLPMVESAFNPRAVSRARAVGIWQFIPSTGKSFGLEQNWWVDERRDIVASTDAALTYLQRIYEMHGDWHLALASYNWGEGAVGRAIERNRARNLPTDYASLTMPAETRHYVPKLQALKNIVAQPELFGFRLPPLPNQPYFETVMKPERIDVAVAARLAGISVEEFLSLNPAYHRPVIYAHRGGPLILPVENVDTFHANLWNYIAEEKPLSDWLTHTMKKGETLAQVAARFKISEARLRQVNGIRPRARIRPGFTLLAPRPGSQAAERITHLLPAAPREKAATAPAAGKRSTVRKKRTQAAPAKPAAAKSSPARPAARPAAASR